MSVDFLVVWMGSIMWRQLFNPIHFGEILQEDFLKEYGVTAYRAAEDMGVPRTRIERVVRGQNSITADTALRLARHFQTAQSSGCTCSAATTSQPPKKQRVT